MSCGVYLFSVALMGACSGSLLTVVVYRLPRMLQQPGQRFSLWLPRSHCTRCLSAIAWYDNIPLLGWLRLAGRCRHCARRIPWRYPLIELACTLQCLLFATLLPFGKPLIAAWILGWFLLALTLIDSEHQLLPDALTQPLLWLGILLHAFHWLPSATLQQSAIGAAGGYLLLWTLACSYRLLYAREGLGMGDAKLLAALGAWLGWQPLPQLLLLASGGSLLWVCLCRLTRDRPIGTPLPFGPALAGAGLLLFIVVLIP